VPEPAVRLQQHRARQQHRGGGPARKLRWWWRPPRRCGADRHWRCGPAWPGRCWTQPCWSWRPSPPAARPCAWCSWACRTCCRRTRPTRGAGACMRLAVERKRLERRRARPTPPTWPPACPTTCQLMEHMTTCWPCASASRRRWPCWRCASKAWRPPRRAGHRGGQRAARKVAVRLRSGLRASDVVASVGSDTFAVLLAWIDEPATANAWRPSWRNRCSGRSRWRAARRGGGGARGLVLPGAWQGRRHPAAPRAGPGRGRWPPWAATMRGLSPRPPGGRRGRQRRLIYFRMSPRQRYLIST
jgi:hypothetical protein